MEDQVRCRCPCDSNKASFSITDNNNNNNNSHNNHRNHTMASCIHKIEEKVDANIQQLSTMVHRITKTIKNINLKKYARFLDYAKVFLLVLLSSLVLMYSHILHHETSALFIIAIVYGYYSAFLDGKNTRFLQKENGSSFFSKYISCLSPYLLLFAEIFLFIYFRFFSPLVPYREPTHDNSLELMYNLLFGVHVGKKASYPLSKNTIFSSFSSYFYVYVFLYTFKSLLVLLRGKTKVSVVIVAFALEVYSVFVVSSSLFDILSVLGFLNKNAPNKILWLSAAKPNKNDAHIRQFVLIGSAILLLISLFISIRRIVKICAREIKNFQLKKKESSTKSEESTLSSDPSIKFEHSSKIDEDLQENIMQSEQEIQQHFESAPFILPHTLTSCSNCEIPQEYNHEFQPSLFFDTHTSASLRTPFYSQNE